jgi:hypothetical protein
MLRIPSGRRTILLRGSHGAETSSSWVFLRRRPVYTDRHPRDGRNKQFYRGQLHPWIGESLQPIVCDITLANHSSRILRWSSCPGFQRMATEAS